LSGKEVAVPLLDHFHPPLSKRLPTWESFYSVWAVSIADVLNGVLPQRYLPAVHRQPGRQVEADVTGFDRPFEPEDGPPGGPVRTWAPEGTGLVGSVTFPDAFEVRVLDQVDDARVVAVVDLVSPRNKDRPEECRAFAAKCAAYLQRGIGLIVIDIVTNRLANLHNELVELLTWGEPFLMPEGVYAVAYRPARRKEKNEIDVWPVPLAVGGTLPLLPLALKGARAVPLDLEAAYTDARQRSRL
jgi:Protein of unknown function (DUF4058)